jgi:hypothetical protein
VTLRDQSHLLKATTLKTNHGELPARINGELGPDVAGLNHHPPQTVVPH